ncbi:EAL domain-containing protein [Clostridium perfringens]|uniref:EAL domain-containing protein n=1 Tax=Clostridium perfringens TaxID=1502 RepID=UPI001B843A34|nr:EAL domain-containing protein [Clostridium perfringens]HBC2033284.1 EAL domain-containing protein [Clostridium perfringens]HBC2056691.1 EAL domain-containing protein [Clostridium perfringens]HBC2070811.1 EAL domain-containing protein [Clostridium perfringens]
MSNFEKLEKHLVYQPKVDLNTLEIVGLEALIRFTDLESLTILNTEKVINEIDSVDEMAELSKYVLSNVISDMKKLERLNCEINISINISSKEICNTNLFNWLVELSQGYKKYVNMIEIEITEKYEVKNTELMRKRISLLRDLGFTISLDDLGAGFNQIDTIQQYEVDLIKVDKSMVRNFKDRNEELRYISNISKKRNVKLLVEGIESEIDLQRFLDLGFEFGQGYYFYEPMKLSQILDGTSLLKSSSRS